MVNAIHGTLETLHSRCRDHGLDTSYVPRPVYKPSLTSNKHSIVISYAHVRQPSDKLCFGHLPILEVICSEGTDKLLPESAVIRQEVYLLHRDATVIKTALAGQWPSYPNTALLSGVGKWPTCPQEQCYGSGNRSFPVGVIRYLLLALGVTFVPKIVETQK